MPMQTTVLSEQRRLELRFSGVLDIDLTHSIWEVCQELPDDLEGCVVDLHAVDHVSNAGMALLHLLCRRLSTHGVWVSLLGGSAALNPHNSHWLEMSALVIWDEIPSDSREDVTAITRHKTTKLNGWPMRGLARSSQYSACSQGGAEHFDCFSASRGKHATPGCRWRSMCTAVGFDIPYTHAHF